MTDSSSSRLDRIESILDTVATQQQINTQPAFLTSLRGRGERTCTRTLLCSPAQEQKASRDVVRNPGHL
ncbi:MAG: hypothetical protein NHB32_06775 [Fischerella sp. CENA71]|nr:hypothetical protein [Fischerella sp. CENA71]MCP6758468.1 hypothetical protein [Fischerella sp. CENA71]